MLHCGKRTGGCTVALLFASTIVAMAHGNGIEEAVAFTYRGVGGGLLILLILLFFVKESWPLKLVLFLLSPFLAIGIGMAEVSVEQFLRDGQPTGQNELAAAWFGFVAEVVPSLLILATIKCARRFRRTKESASSQP